MTMAANETDGRESAVPDEPNRPSCVVVLPPARPPCVVCGRAGTKRRRRKTCITCLRKFRDTGNALPPEATAAPPGPARGSVPPAPPRDPLLWLIDRMTPGQRDKALAYLGELAGRAPDAKP